MDRFQPSPIRNELVSDTWGIEAVKPRDVQIGIESPKWSYWGGNIKKVGDTYNLFVCRWPENHPKGHMAWNGSTVVRATAPNPWGPYQPAEEIGKGHNPELFRAKDGSFILYVIDGYYESKRLDGPWTPNKFEFRPRGRRVIEGFSNFSFAPRRDGSVIAVCRGGGIWFSQTGKGPWNQVTNRRAYPNVKGAFEDPVIWKTDVQYHMIVNDWLGRIAWYLRSKNGFEWKVEPGEAYLPGIDRYEDGTKVDWYKYERLKVLQDEKGRAYQANFAVIDYSKWEDKPNDIHSSKNICLPLTKGRLLSVLNKNPLGPNTEKIEVKILAEPGFDPQQDLNYASLRFGASDEVNFGRGCRLIESRSDGKDVVLVFAGQGNGFKEDHFAGKLIGETSGGQLLFGYTRIPGVEYETPFLSADLPVVSVNEGQLDFKVKVTNFGMKVSGDQMLRVVLFSDSTRQEFDLSLPPLHKNQEVELSESIQSALDLDLQYQVKITANGQSTPLYETENHKKAPQLIIGRSETTEADTNR